MTRFRYFKHEIRDLWARVRAKTTFNLLDILIVAFFVAMLPAGYHLKRFLAKNTNAVAAKQLAPRPKPFVVLAAVGFKGPSFLLSMVQIDDVIFNRKGEEIGWVRAIDIAENDEGEATLEVQLALKVKPEIKRRLVFLDNAATVIKPGREFILETGKYYLSEGIIRSVISDR